MLDAIAQRMRAGTFVAFKVFGSPHTAIRLGNLNRLIQHNGGWRIAIVQGGGIHDRLERRARLARRLRHPVKFRLIVGEPADHGQHTPGIGVHRDNAAGNFRNLTQTVLPGADVQGVNVNHIPRLHGSAHLAPSGPADAIQPQSASFTLARHFARFLALGLQADTGGGVIGFQHHRQTPWLHIAQSLNFNERQAPILRNINHPHRAAIAMGFIITHQPIDQCFTRPELHLGVKRGANRKATLFQLGFAIAIQQIAAHLFGEIARDKARRVEHTRIDTKRL